MCVFSLKDKAMPLLLRSNSLAIKRKKFAIPLEHDAGDCTTNHSEQTSQITRMGNENYLAKKYLLFFTVPTEEIRPASTSRYRIVLVVDKPNPSEEAMSFALHCPLFSKKERIFVAIFSVGFSVGVFDRIRFSFDTKTYFLTLLIKDVPMNSPMEILQ